MQTAKKKNEATNKVNKTEFRQGQSEIYKNIEKIIFLGIWSSSIANLTEVRWRATSTFATFKHEQIKFDRMQISSKIRSA